MRVSNRTIYQSINDRLSAIADQLRTVNEQIASGKKINRLSDDPIGLTHALRLKKVLSQMGQYGKNVEHGQSWLNLTESSLQNVNTLVIRAKEIANQMATGTYSGAQRSSAAWEIQNLMEQLVQIGNTKLTGRYIFSGYKEDTAAFTDDLYIHNAIANSGNNPAYTGSATSSGAYTGLYSKQYVVRITTGGAVGTATYAVSEDGGLTWGSDVLTSFAPAGTPVYNDNNSTDQGARITFTDFGTLTADDQFTIEVSRYNGDRNDMEIAIGNSSQIKVNLAGNVVLGEAGDKENNILDILAGLNHSLQNNDIPGVSSALEELNQYQPLVMGNLADVGSRLNRLEMSKNLLSELELSNTTRLSEIEDVDVVRAITDLKAREQIYQAALYSATQIMQLSLVDFLK
jgi:flagellar hook-associated protein 3 FlgL